MVDCIVFKAISDIKKKRSEQSKRSDIHHMPRERCYKIYQIVWIRSRSWIVKIRRRR